VSPCQKGMAVMQCQRCQREIPEDESFLHLGQTLCEDCYLDIRQPVKACDPWAVYLAGRSRDSVGAVGTEGLTELQKAICEFVQGRGKVTAEELTDHFGLSGTELQSQVAVLRHCELLRGQKEADKVYIVPFR
jgi:hypothetical protein